jgi:NADH-quinone oxidoreductase subunit N
MNVILILSALGLLTLFAGVYNMRKMLIPLVVFGLICALAVNVMAWNEAGPETGTQFYSGYIKNMMNFDHYAIAFTALLILSCIFIFFLCEQYYKDEMHHAADIYGLIIFTLVGGVMMTSFSHMAMLFIGIETLSISLYILAGSKKLNLASNEASLKYFLLGSFSTGFLLFGICLIYGATGSFDLSVIKDWVIKNASSPQMNMMNSAGYNPWFIFKAGLFLMSIGLLFKISAAPFHFWTPDVYEGSPTLITAFMASVVKIAGFAAMFRLFYNCFGSIVPVWVYTIGVAAILTIIIGNFSAVYQKSVKRMLAYSSIANVGYILIAVVSMNDVAQSALLYYLAAYSVATIAAFGVLIVVSQAKNSEDYEAFNGLAKRNPFLAAILVLSMISLAGIPPLAGFFGKYYIFNNAIMNTSNVNGNFYIALVIIAALSSLLGIVYYFKLIVAVFAPEADPTSQPIKATRSFNFILAIAALLILLLGIFPDWVIGLL